MKCKKKIVFSKNTKRNKFYIKRYNFLNIPIVNLELSLGNYYIKINEIVHTSQDGNSSIEYKIHLYNQLIDTSEINLDTTNIKKVPIKLIYIFPISISGVNDQDQLEYFLNKFIGTKKFINPFSFDNLNDEKIKFSLSNTEYIKYSDYFLTFFLNYYCENQIYSVNGVIRIDFIYSENFDIIFIGVVKKDEKSYVKTFEFKMDNIDKFILQNLEDNTGFYLKVRFKDNQIQDIWSFKKISHKDLEELVYLLNERLIN